MSKDEKGGSCMSDVFLIKVYDYEDKQISGKLFDVARNRHYEYSNLTQILLTIRHILESGTEETIEKKDVFSTASKEGEFELITGEKSWLYNKIRVFRKFKLEICFTKFNTWQGELWCIDSGTHSAFRSMLELVMLMDSELAEASAALPEAASGGR